ncbi:MAG: hypothetical protein K0R54_2376 [Clostridiaceae bacterium]|jgi:hypothetical protein|nr:hypothetical protein [Clostridiaceae bacterium]
MEININGLNVDKASCVATPFKFGKSVDNLPNILKFKYTINIDLQSFIKKFETIFNEFVDDCKIDDELYPEEGDTLLLKENGYPKLQYLIDNNRKFLSEFTINNLGLEFIECMLCERVSEVQYVICNITDIIINENSVIVTGECIRYQDKN